MALRTVTLPVNVGASWDDLAWEQKAPGDTLPYTLDCTAWLGTLTIEDVEIEATAGLIVGEPALIGTTGVAIQIGGGAANTTAQVWFDLSLSGGNSKEVLVSLPIGAALPSGLVAVSADDSATLGAIL